MNFKIYQFALIIIFCSIVLSCAKNSIQNINEDTAKWGRFDTVVEEIIISYIVPPDGKVFKRPDDVTDLSKYEYPWEVIGYFGYDYPSKRNWDPSNFSITIWIRKNTTDLDMLESYETFREAEFDTRVTKGSRHSAKNIIVNNKQWLHEGDLSYGGEYFARPLTSDYILGVTGAYREKIQSDPEWLESRRKITRIVLENLEVVE